MKNAIFALLVLLVALIATCVYEKTYTLYSTSPQKLTLIERNMQKNTPTQSKSPAKPEEEGSTSAVSALSVGKLAVKTEESVLVKTKEETALLAKSHTATAKIASVMKEKESAAKSTPIQKPQTVTQEATKEIVDYIMWALKNREIALKNRDEVEARVESLITKALNDRKVVLDERSSNEITLKNMQTELIKARDASYESIINPKTIHKGEI